MFAGSHWAFWLRILAGAASLPRSMLLTSLEAPVMLRRLQTQQSGQVEAEQKANDAAATSINRR